jgi:hypothetical protein
MSRAQASSTGSPALANTHAKLVQDVTSIYVDATRDPLK